LTNGLSNKEQEKKTKAMAKANSFGLSQLQMFDKIYCIVNFE